MTARTGEPHVRVDLAERVLVTWLVLDTSVSMQFGTADRRKADVAEGVAVAIGHLATRRGNRLGVVTFGGEESRAHPTDAGTRGPRRAADRSSQRAGRRRAGHDGRSRAALRTHGRARSPALARRGRLRLPRASATGDAPLLALSGHHDVVAVEVRDPREQELSDVGLLYLVDPETGRQLRVDTRSRRLRERFAVAAAAERARARALALVGRRPARRAHDVGRLAAPARHLPAQEPLVRFDWPLALAALALLPVLVALYLDRDRRRVASQAEFGNPDLLPNVVDRSPGRLRYLPPLTLLVALVVHDRRRRASACDRERSARGGDDRARASTCRAR